MDTPEQTAKPKSLTLVERQANLTAQLGQVRQRLSEAQNAERNLIVAAHQIEGALLVINELIAVEAAETTPTV